MPTGTITVRVGLFFTRSDDEYGVFYSGKSLLKVCHDPNFFFNKREKITLINEQKKAEKVCFQLC